MKLKFKNNLYYSQRIVKYKQRIFAELKEIKQSLIYSYHSVSTCPEDINC